jgi:hypothetical protein
MSDEAEDFLAHYGVVGMQWGKHKRQDETSGSNKPKAANDPKATPTSQYEKRDSRRKAKSDKILAKADDVQKQIDDLKKNGTNSEFMLKKYGPAMGIDSRSADMSVQFRHKHSKQELLDAELKGLEASKSHFLADAKLASAGKLTQKEKMIIGAGVATIVLAAGITYAVVNDKQNKKVAAEVKLASQIARLDKQNSESYVKSVAIRSEKRKKELAERLAKEKFEEDRFNSIAPGSKITYDDYWKKIEHTEMSRVSGISKDAFDKMDETPISVPAGHIFKRVSTDKEEILRKQIYATYKDVDNDRYQAVLPKFWNQWGIGSEAKGGYVVSIKAKEAIVSPSQKDRVKAFIELMDEPVKGKTKSAWGTESADEVTKSGKEWLVGKSNMSSEDAALAMYRNFSLGLVNKTPLSDAYFDKLKSKGFNAIIDDNDSGKLSDSPMLIFDTSKSMERLGATPLTQENINAARQRIVEVLQRA